jgi:endonuclease YncB( thermonuclease family)
MRRLSGLLFVAALVLLTTAPVRAEILAGPANGLDEDSIAVGGERVRLWGIDAPDLGQTCNRGGKPWACGRDSARALERLVGGKMVRCLVILRDKMRRLVVGDCTLGGESLSRWMIVNGYAVMNTRQTDAYAKEEAEAREAKRGVWGSTFDPPWEWRARQKQRGR